MHSIFKHIDLTKIQYIGAGVHAICFTDMHYVIKIGFIPKNDIDMLRRIYTFNFAPKIIEYATSIEYKHIPLEIMNCIQNGYTVEGVALNTQARYFNSRYQVQAVIMQYAKPLMNHTIKYTDEVIKENYLIAEEIKDELFRLSQIKWIDAHPWNIGELDNRYVIFDW